MEQPTATTTTATTTNEKVHNSNNVLVSPIWVFALRGLQVLISLIILALSGSLIHDAYLDEWGLNVAIPVITWLAVAYIVLTEVIAPLRSAYHIFAVLAIDGVMMILWLATFAATAAKRAKYKYAVTVSGCYDDGSLTSSKHCYTARDVILFKPGLAKMAAMAGLGALVWLLFIATFVWVLISFLGGRKQGRFAFGSGSPTGDSTPNNYQMDSKPQPTSAAQPVPTYQQPQPTAPYQQVPTPQQQQGPYQHPPYQQVPTPQPAPYQQVPTPEPGYQQQQGQYTPQQNYQPSPYSPSPVAYPPQEVPGQEVQAPQEVPANPAYHHQEAQGQQPYGQYPPHGQQHYGNELDGHNQYSTPPPAAVSPPPQQYNYPPQN